MLVVVVVVVGGGDGWFARQEVKKNNRFFVQKDFNTAERINNYGCVLFSRVKKESKIQREREKESE